MSTLLPATTRPLTRVTALALTEQIRKAVNRTWELLLAAYEGQAHIALGYKTWESYIKTEFDLSRQQSYKLITVGEVTRALEEATGAVSHASDTPIQVSVREAQAVKPHLEEVRTEVAQAVEQGAEPNEAVREAVAKRVPPKANKARPAPVEDEPDPEAEAIEAEEAERRAKVIPVNAVPMLERGDVIYLVKSIEDADPRTVARLITERELSILKRWLGSVVAARQELQPLSEAARKRQAEQRQKANAR